MAPSDGTAGAAGFFIFSRDTNAIAPRTRVKSSDIEQHCALSDHYASGMNLG